MSIKDSGERREFETGAVRDMSAGKGRYDLLPMRGIECVAKVMEDGALKYSDRNWERGINVHSFIDSAMRHLAKFARGDCDEGHLAQAAWNVLCALDTRARVKLGMLPADLDDIGVDTSISTPSGELDKPSYIGRCNPHDALEKLLSQNVPPIGAVLQQYEPAPIPTVSRPSALVDSGLCSGFDETCQDDPCPDCDLMNR